MVNPRKGWARMHFNSTSLLDSPAMGSRGERINVGEIVAALERIFGTAFSLLNIETAEYLCRGGLCPAGDPAIYSEICRELVSRGAPNSLLKKIRWQSSRSQSRSKTPRPWRRWPRS